ncbi:hypothetical protein G9P44_002390 [Scheffersomyces stipitis]|nr:hypothetical protein G9P44_002390 [Scheffersomyces stipitis]
MTKLEDSEKSIPVSVENGKEEVFEESNAGDGTRREDQYLHGYRLALCVVALLLSLFIMSISQTIILIILTEVGNKFDGVGKINWITSGYLLAIAVLTQTWGKLSILIGRKLTLSISLIFFEAGTLLCALSNSMDMLIGGRVLAGVGAGGIQASVFVVLSEVLPIQYRTYGMMLMSMTGTTASIIGPLIGGALSRVSWRWCFYFNIPIGGAAFVYLQLFFNPPKPKGKLLKKLKLLDYVGTLLVCGAAVLILLGLSFGSNQEFDWKSAPVIVCLTVGGLLLIAFLIWNFNYSKYPLIPVDVAKSWQVEASVLTGCAMFGYFFSNQIYISVYFQVIHGWNAWESGLHLLPLIISSVISSIGGSLLIQKTKFIKPFSIFAAACGLVGNSILYLLDVDSNLAKIIGLLILPGLSTGMQVQSTVMLVQVSAPKTAGSTIMATTYYNFLRTLCGAVAADLATLTYNESLKSKLTHALSNITDPALAQELSSIELSEILSNTTILNQLSSAAQYFIKNEIMGAIRNVFHVSAGFGGLCLIASCFQVNHRLPTKSKGVENDETIKVDKETSS